MKKLTLLKRAAALALASSWVAGSAAATFYSTTVLNDQPVAYWNFDEPEGNAVQQAPLTSRPVTSENDLAPVAGAARVSHATINSGLAKLGNAADFHGTNFFRAPALRAGKGELSGAYAIEFWMQAQGENSNNREDYLMNIGGNGPGMIYDFNPDQIEMYAGASRTANGPTLNDNSWHHVVFVYYGDAFDGVADRVDAYLDGVNFPGIGNLYTKRMDLSQLVVGAALANGANGFEGRIDEVAIYDLSNLPDETAVTDKITAVVEGHRQAATGGAASYSSVVMADQPLLYWNFDETEGNAEQLMPITLPQADNTRNELQPFYDATRIPHTTAGSGLQLGNALDLNATGGFFGKTGGFDLGVASIPGPWAIEMWFQIKGDQENKYFMNLGGPALGPNSPAVIYGYFGPRIEVYGAGGGRSRANGVAVADRNWHHMLIVNHNTAAGTDTPGEVVNRVDMYLDNVLYENIGGGFNKAMDFGDFLFFGAAVDNPDPAASGNMNARLDELAFYDLSTFTNTAELNTKAAAMASSHYAAGFGGTSAGTITFTQQPTGVSSTIGQTATFNAAANVTGTTLPLTFQWERNGVSILGATNSTYALPVSINEIGTNVFRLRASAGPVFKFSDAAILTVAAPPTPPATFYSSQVLQDDPVLYWNFDELVGPASQLAPIERAAITENDLVATGNAGRSSHVDLGSGLTKLGKAVVFDGTGFLRTDRSRLPKTMLTGPYVIETWAQFNGGADEYIANFGPVGGDNSPAFIHNFTKPGYLELFGGGGGRTAAKGPAIADASWHHLVWVVYNNAPAGSTNRVDAYFDGVLMPDVGNGFSRNLDLRAFMLGAALASGVNGMSGALDEFAVYDLAGLTDGQVATKAASIATNHYTLATSTGGADYSTTVLADNPILYYNFEEDGGNAIQRAPVALPPVDNSANALVNNGAARVQHSAAGTSLNLGNAAQFDGLSFFQATSLDPSKGAIKAPWAVEFWVQVLGENATDRQDYLLSFGNEGLSFIYDYKPDQLEMYAGAPRTDAGPTISDNNWHHVLWVFYGDGVAGVADRVDAYLDGTQFTGLRSTFSRDLPLLGSLVIGAARPGYNGFEGRIDEVAVYDLGGLTDEAAVTAKVTELVTSHIEAANTSVPTLSASRNGNTVTLTWSTSGFALQESASLAPGATWGDVPNGQNSPVTVNIDSAGNRFFRLIKR